MVFRYLVTVGAAALLLTAALPTAQAEEAGSDTARIDLSSMSYDELCELVRQCQRGQGSERCRQARHGARDAWRLLLARLDNIESRLGELEQHDHADIEAELERLNALIVNLQLRMDQLAALRGDLDDVARRVGELEDRQDDDEQGTRDRLQSLGIRITQLLEDLRRFQLGLTFGGTGLYSLDGTLYGGFLTGPRLSIRVTDTLDVFFELQLSVTDGVRPLGLRGRGGLQMEMIHGILILESGVSCQWVGYNNLLQARSAFLMADLGLEVRPHPIIGLGLAVVLGVEFDQDDPEFTHGLVGTLGFYFPRW